MPTFDPDTDIPSLEGKVIFVTGGNNGLGKETVRQLAKHNARHIYLAARTESKAKHAIEDIQKQVTNPSPITFIELDLASFASIKRAASSFLSQSQELHVLLNNAGVMNTPPGLTQDGYEMQFGTNHVGHALLTRLLLPTLVKTSASGSEDVRIVTLSSGGEMLAPKGPYPFADFKTEMGSIGTWSRYGYSKLANAHHSRGLAKRYPDLRCVAVHPGVISTNLFDGTFARIPLISSVVNGLAKMLMTGVEAGTKNQLWAAVSADAKSGHFYHPIGVDGKGSQRVSDDALADSLWEWTEKEISAHAT